MNRRLHQRAVERLRAYRRDGNQALGIYHDKAMGSEQAGLAAFKGSIVRKVAVSRTASSLEKSLAAIRNTLEGKQ